MVDPNKDVNEVCAIILAAEKNGCVILGGGSPKNFYLQGQPTLWEVYGIPKGGNDYFIQITTDSVVWGGLSGATPAEAVSWGKVNPGVLPDTVRRLRATPRSRSRCSANTPSATRTAGASARGWCTSSSMVAALKREAIKARTPVRRRQKRRTPEAAKLATQGRRGAGRARLSVQGWERSGRSWGRSPMPVPSARASMPTPTCRRASSRFMRESLRWDVLFVIEHPDLRRARDIEHYRLARQLRRTLITLDRDYLDDRRFPPAQRRRASW